MQSGDRQARRTGSLLCRVGSGHLNAAAAAFSVVVATAGGIVRYTTVFAMGRVLGMGARGFRVRRRSVSAPGKTDRGAECSREHKGGCNREYEASVDSHFPRPR